MNNVSFMNETNMSVQTLCFLSFETPLHIMTEVINVLTLLTKKQDTA